MAGQTPGPARAGGGGHGEVTRAGRGGGAAHTGAMAGASGELPRQHGVEATTRQDGEAAVRGGGGGGGAGIAAAGMERARRRVAARNDWRVEGMAAAWRSAARRHGRGGCSGVCKCVIVWSGGPAENG